MKSTIVLQTIKNTPFQLTENYGVKDLKSEEDDDLAESSDSVSAYPDHESVVDWNEDGNGLHNVAETLEAEKMSFLGMRLPVAGDISKSRAENRTAYIAATSFVESLKLRRNSARTSPEDKQKIESVLSVAAISTAGFTPEVLRSVQAVVRGFSAEAVDGGQAANSEPQSEPKVESSEPMKYTPEEAEQMVAAVDRVLEKPVSTNETVAKTVDTVAAKKEKPKKRGWFLAALGLTGLAALFAYDEKKDADVLEALRAKNAVAYGDLLEDYVKSTIQNTKTIDALTSATTEEAMSRNVIAQPIDSVESVSATLTQEYDTTFPTLDNPDVPKMSNNEVTVESEEIKPKPLPEVVAEKNDDAQIAVESVPVLSDYVVEKTDVLWNFALGKIDGVATLPALAEISEDEQVSILAKAVQELRTDAKWQEKVGVVSGNPDLIYPGHVIHTEALNDLMKEIITKSGNT